MKQKVQHGNLDFDGDDERGEGKGYRAKIRRDNPVKIYQVSSVSLQKTIEWPSQSCLLYSL